ncbi:hypothetical protein GF1_12410 [Desulfolithobacter dissulfuricans]|uniref:histidine kinase n=1 Tax=Desulfolithobacter dissulfuricans TaxID=2795293 RepID=A0A915U137_9BACT|nr:response regulator [Desulfolithobacter dissulfuricans]BCO08865.1 hypothetical protein GF1_12410 [Desulfolithobacter dissulfuricans]
MLRRLIWEDISIKTILAEDLPNIKADKSQIDQILINLVLNARDALGAVLEPNFKKKIIIETGNVILDNEDVSSHSGGKKGQHVFFAVSDNGIGMTKETKRQIFEPFFTAKEKGTGLGLSMVYGIVKQNNGSIYVYTEPDEGTMFKIYWPVCNEEVSLEKNIHEETVKLSSNETILLVEDDENVRNFASVTLESLGYKVYQASNGRIALDLIHSGECKFDLILTDLIMPEMNGKELVEQVKKILPESKVIYVSGYTDNHIVHNGLLEEGVKFLHKPYSVDSLAKIIRQVLDQK